MESLKFSTDSFAEADRYEAWRMRGWPSLASVMQTRRPEGPFYAHCETYVLGSLALTYSSITGLVYERLPSNVRHDDLDHIGLLLMLDGRYTGETPSGGFEGGPGSLLIGDFGRRYAQESTDAVTVTLTIPRALARQSLPHLEGMHGMILSASGAAYLKDYLSMLRRHLPILPEASAPRLAAGILQSLAICLQTTHGADHEPLFRSERERVEWFIERHLDDPDLGVGRLASLTGLARARLYRLYAGEGGVAAAIRRNRLEHARQMLGNVGEHQSVGAIARAAGFREQAQFSRAYRAHFGVAPRDHRRIPGDARAVPDESRRLERFDKS